MALAAGLTQEDSKLVFLSNMVSVPLQHGLRRSSQSVCFDVSLARPDAVSAAAAAAALGSAKINLLFASAGLSAAQVTSAAAVRLPSRS